MWSLLRTRRWLGFSAVVVVAIIAFGLLSAWQWSRSEERRLEGQQLQASLATEASPLAALASRVSGDEVLPDWLPVEVTGTYRDEQALVRKRPLQSRNGFWVMTPLSSPAGTVWVNRGWIAASADALATPPVPPPPAGEVTVSGYLRPFTGPEPDGSAGLPIGQVSDPDLSQLPAVDALPLGYLHASASTPTDSLTLLPPPEIDGARNLSYAVQWGLFALVAIGGWFFFLRREAREDHERAVDTAASSADSLTGA